MTTTKEDQIRAGYKKWLDDNHLIEFPTDTSHPNQISYPFEAYKACAESYEKKLAEKEEAIAAEREECAKTCEAIAADYFDHAKPPYEICAKAIRERSNAEVTANSEAELKINGKE